MTNHRQVLELAALAIDRNFVPGESWDEGAGWNPLENSGDAADMCAALGTDTKWGASIVACGSDNVLRWLAEPCAKLEYRPAAWRLAALRVAAEIGKGMRG